MEDLGEHNGVDSSTKGSRPNCSQYTRGQYIVKNPKKTWIELKPRKLQQSICNNMTNYGKAESSGAHHSP